MSFAVEGAVQRANRRTEARVVFVRGRRTGAWTELTCVLLGLASVSQRSCETLVSSCKKEGTIIHSCHSRASNFAKQVLLQKEKVPA